MSPGGMDLFISAIEINDHHGVGILLRRYFPDSANAISLRSTSQHGGVEPFGSLHWELFSRFLPLAETESRLRALLATVRVRRILAVPYFREDFIHAVLAKRITGAPLCAFIMDDQNVFAPEVPDAWVADLLEAADLRLGISPELCEAYQRKFGHKLDVMPPVLTPGAAPVPNHWIPGSDSPFTCAMIGNVWTKPRFERLRRAVRGAGIRVHWYGNGPKAAWLEADPGELARDGIEVMGFFPEEELARLLSSYPLVIVPTGELNDDDDNPAFSRLSLPSRVVFIAARSNVPILVMGHGETAAGRFVRTLRIGNCCGYNPEQLLAGIAHLTEPKRRDRQCARLRSVQSLLTHSDPGAWIWSSLGARRAQPAPWRAAFRPRRTWYGRSLERPPHLEITPARPRPKFTTPLAWPDVHDADLPGFSFTRRNHLGLACPGVDEADIALDSLLGLLAAGLALRLAPRTGHWLLFGPDFGGVETARPPEVGLWQISDIHGWLDAGLPLAEPWIRPLGSGAVPSAIPSRFDAILAPTVASCVQESERGRIEGWRSFVRSAAAPGAFQVHGFNGVLREQLFHAHGLYWQLRDEITELGGRPGRDEILTAGDFWLLGEQAFNGVWLPVVKQSYAAFGRPFGLMHAWRGASPAVSRKA